MTPEQEIIDKIEAQYPQLLAKVDEANGRIARYSEEIAALQDSQQIENLQENVRVAQELADEITASIEALKRYVEKLKAN